MKCQACGTEMSSQQGQLLSDHVVRVEGSLYWECPHCGSFSVVAQDEEYSGRVLAAGWLLQGSRWPS